MGDIIALKFKPKLKLISTNHVNKVVDEDNDLTIKLAAIITEHIKTNNRTMMLERTKYILDKTLDNIINEQKG